MTARGACMPVTACRNSVAVVAVSRIAEVSAAPVVDVEAPAVKTTPRARFHDRIDTQAAR